MASSSAGSPSRIGLNKLFDEMMKLQNEPLNALRTALKNEQLESARTRKLIRTCWSSSLD